jgi:spermidine synthase
MNVGPPRASNNVVVPMALVGASALTAQAGVVRELMVSFGGTELALALALGFWLVWVALGACAGALAGRARGAHTVFSAALVALAAGLPASMLVARSVRVLLRADTGQFLGLPAMAAGAALATAPAAIWVGFLFPIAARLALPRAPNGARSIAHVYVAEAVGSAAAGAALSFWLLGRAEPMVPALAASVMLCSVGAWCSAAVSAVPCAVAAAAQAALLCACTALACPQAFFGLAPVLTIAVWAARGRGAGKGLLALALAFALAQLLAGPAVAAAASALRWSTVSRFRLVAERDSRYQHAALGERAGIYVLVQDGIRSAQFPDPVPSRHMAALLLAEHPHPRRVLLLGGGLGGLCQEMLQAPLERLDYAEPDPQLLGLVYDHLPPDLRRPLADARLTIYDCDARYFVRRCLGDRRALARRVWAASAGRRATPHAADVGHYDLVLLNCGDPTSARSARLYSLEALTDVARVLRSGGVVGMCGMTGSENYLAGEPVLGYAASLYWTIRSALGPPVVRPGDDLCFFSGRSATSDPLALTARLDDMGFGEPLLRRAVPAAQFPPERSRAALHTLEAAADRATINTDDRPALFALFLAVQSYYSGARPGAPSALRTLMALARASGPLWPLVATVAAASAAAVALLLGRGRARPWACGLTVLTTGAFGLATEMLLVYRYQTAFGYVYRDIGLLVGLYMLGLSVGGWVAGRRFTGEGTWTLLAAEAGQVCYLAALVPLMPVVCASPAAFMAAAALAGFLTGCVFPSASRVGLASGLRTGTIAGLYDAADHTGAVLGAMITGLLLIPAVGVTRSAELTVALKAVSLAPLATVLLGRQTP